MQNARIRLNLHAFSFDASASSVSFMHPFPTHSLFLIQEWSNQKVWIEVVNGYRLPPPPDCPAHIAHIMKQCWLHESVERPRFSRILDLLKGIPSSTSADHSSSTNSATFHDETVPSNKLVGGRGGQQGDDPTQPRKRGPSLSLRPSYPSVGEYLGDDFNDIDDVEESRL